MDSGIDSDKGIYINGGTVTATGNMLDRIEGEGQTYAVFGFAQAMDGGGEIILRNIKGEAVYTCTPENGYSNLIIAGDFLQPGEYTLWQGETQLAGGTGGRMGGFGGMGGMMPPEDFDPNAMPEPELPEGFRGQHPKDAIKPNADGAIILPDGATPNPKDIPQPELPQENLPDMPAPDGFGGGRSPGNFGGKGDDRVVTISPTFIIAEGGNMFSSVQIYQGE